MKITLKNLKPRNPIAGLAMKRAAGSHRLRTGAQRQQAARALRQEIERLRPSP
jgi:hypothetical protein